MARYRVSEISRGSKQAGFWVKNGYCFQDQMLFRDCNFATTSGWGQKCKLGTVTKSFLPFSNPYFSRYKGKNERTTSLNGTCIDPFRCFFFPDRQMLISPLPISRSISHVKRQGEKKSYREEWPATNPIGQWIKTCIVRKKESRAFQLDRRIEMLHEHCSEFPVLFESEWINFRKSCFFLTVVTVSSDRKWTWNCSGMSWKKNFSQPIVDSHLCP